MQNNCTFKTVHWLLFRLTSWWALGSCYKTPLVPATLRIPKGLWAFPPLQDANEQDVTSPAAAFMTFPFLSCLMGAPSNLEEASCTHSWSTSLFFVVSVALVALWCCRFCLLFILSCCFCLPELALLILFPLLLLTYATERMCAEIVPVEKIIPFFGRVPKEDASHTMSITLLSSVLRLRFGSTNPAWSEI